jgi:hypothetical protein
MSPLYILIPLGIACIFSFIVLMNMLFTTFKIKDILRKFNNEAEFYSTGEAYIALIDILSYHFDLKAWNWFGFKHWLYPHEFDIYDPRFY